MKTQYTVAAGQSLSDIAIEVGGAYEYIFVLLALNPGLSLGQELTPGQQIQIDRSLAVTPVVARHFQDRNYRVAGGIVYQPEPGSADTTPPVVVEFVPAHLAQGVLPSADIAMKFSEPVVKGAGTMQVYTSEGDLVASVPVGSLDVIVNVAEVTVRLPQLSYGTAYYFIFPEGYFVDIAGNEWAGILAANQYRWETEPVVFFPLPGSVAVNADIDPYIEVSGVVTRGAGNARLWVAAEAPINDFNTVIYDIQEESEVEIRTIGTKTRITFLNAIYPAPGDLPLAGISIPAGWIFIDGVSWEGTETPPTTWTWEPAAYTTDFQVVESSVAEGAATSSRTIWFRWNRKLGSVNGVGIRYTVGDALTATPATAIWPYEGRRDIAAITISADDWNAALTFKIEVLAGDYITDRTGTFSEAYELNIERTPLPILATANPLIVTIQEPTCAGAFSATVRAVQGGTTVKTASYTQANFPQNDLALFMDDLLPGSYVIEMNVTDCATSVSVESDAVRALDVPPQSDIEYASGILFLTAQSQAPYSSGAFDAVLTIRQGGTVVHTESFDETDLPAEYALADLELEEGDYEATLTVTAPDSQTASDLVSFRYEVPCADVVFPDLATTDLVDSWSDTGGSSVQINWVQTDPPMDTIWDWIIDTYGAVDGQNYFDQIFRPQTITPRLSPSAFTARFPAGAPNTTPFEGTYGHVTRYVGPNATGNSEAGRGIIMPNGDMLMYDRAGTWTGRVYWLEDAAQTKAVGQVHVNIAWNAPPNPAPGSVNTLGGNRLLTDSSNTVGVVRVMSGRPGWIGYIRDNEIWAYDIFTGQDHKLVVSPLGNIGSPPQDRNSAGMDGNDMDPYFVMTHSTKNEFARMIDPVRNKLLWEELTGPDGAKVWIESEYDASTDATRYWNFPADLDYAAALPDGSGVVAAIPGSGMVLYSRSGLVIGQIFSASNHFECGQFLENGVWRTCIYTFLTGQANEDTGIFSGVFLKDIVAILWDLQTDAAGNRSIVNRRVYKVANLSRNGNTDPQKIAGQIAWNRNDPYSLVVAVNRNKDQVYDSDYPYTEQTVICRCANDTDYPVMLLDNTWAALTPANTNIQPEAAALGRSRLRPNVSYFWNRGFVTSGQSNKLFIYEVYDRPADSVITANID